jgi:hypothetical protein
MLEMQAEMHVRLDNKCQSCSDFNRIWSAQNFSKIHLTRMYEDQIGGLRAHWQTDGWSGILVGVPHSCESGSKIYTTITTFFLKKNTMRNTMVGISIEYKVVF